MKKSIILALMTCFIASLAFAQAKDVVVLKAKNGDITFNHKAHSTANDCKVCHGEGTPAKIELDKDSAHKLCWGCHEEKKAGPSKSKCMDCHKKK